MKNLKYDEGLSDFYVSNTALRLSSCPWVLSILRGYYARLGIFDNRVHILKAYTFARISYSARQMIDQIFKIIRVS